MIRIVFTPPPWGVIAPSPRAKLRRYAVYARSKKPPLRANLIGSTGGHQPPTEEHGNAHLWSIAPDLAMCTALVVREFNEGRLHAGKPTRAFQALEALLRGAGLV